MFKTILSYRKKEESLFTDKQALLVNFIAITALFALLYATVSFLIEFNYGIIAMVICFFIFVFTLLLFLKEKINYKTTSNLYIGNAYFVAITTCSFFSGGDISPVLSWFILIPVISLLLLGRCRTTFIWLSLSIVAMLSAALAGIYGYSFPVAFNYDLVKHFSLICIVGLAAIVFIVTILFEKEKEKSYQLLEEKNHEIIDSINYAKRIQTAILPPKKLVKEYFQKSFILYKPKDIVSGDFYWIETINNSVLFAVADCTGHGVPGAIVSVICNNGLNRSVREYGLSEPGEILDKTREIVIQEFEKSEDDVRDGMDIAICSLNNNRLKYAGAHNPLWIIRNGVLLETKANREPIGKFDTQLPYTTHSFDLKQGDSIYLFSDGYVDQFGGEKDKKFKAKAFKELLLSIQNQSMEEQKKIIGEEFEKWKGNLEQLDDVCVIGVKI